MYNSSSQQRWRLLGVDLHDGAEALVHEAGVRVVLLLCELKLYIDIMLLIDAF